MNYKLYNVVTKTLLLAMIFLLSSAQLLTAQTSITEKRKLARHYETSPATFPNYKKDIVAFSKRARASNDHESRVNAVLDLCMLYYTIRTDTRYSQSEALQGYVRRIHYRLNQTKKSIEKDLKKDGLSKKQSEFLQNVSKVQSQKLDDDALLTASIGLSDQMTLMSQANGGPHHVVNYAGGYFGGIMQSNANDLIDLIEEMIHPDSWENAGGVGGMRYWSQSMVIVIRATTEVHEDIERFLNMLRYSR